MVKRSGIVCGLEVLCSDPKRIFGFFWCFDLLTFHEQRSLEDRRTSPIVQELRCQNRGNGRSIARTSCIMFAKIGDCASFERLGIPHRHTFSHYAVVISKAYPDSRLVFERRGMSDRIMKTGKFYQLNLYTSDFHLLPE